MRRTRAGEDAATGGRAVAGRGGEAMLDEVIVDAWEGLAAARAVACPVCGGAMAPAVPGAEGRAPQGACSDCGAELS